MILGLSLYFHVFNFGPNALIERFVFALGRYSRLWLYLLYYLYHHYAWKCDFNDATKQISLSGVEWWSSFISSLRFDPFHFRMVVLICLQLRCDLCHTVAVNYKRCSINTRMKQAMAPSMRYGGHHLLVAYKLSCFQPELFFISLVQTSCNHGPHMV